MTTATTTGRHRKPEPETASTVDGAVTALFILVFHLTALFHRVVLPLARWFHLRSLLAAKICIGAVAGMVFVGVGLAWWFL